jgi:hypothetical protein
MTDQTTSLSAALTCNGLEIWGIHTYMVTPTLDDVLKHEDASGQSSFQGNAQELLEALGNIKSDDPGTRSALRESIAYGNQILSKQRFVDQVISAYHNGDEPAGKWTSQHDEILGITSAAILKAALASKTVTTTFNHSNLKRLVNVALSFDRPASLDASDWLELATRCLGKI